MRAINRVLLSFVVVASMAQYAFSADVWVNDLRQLFQNNAANICEINIRTFGAQDTNKNGIIEFSEGEESGNFLNAIEKLDELAQKNINTIHVMPITPVGKTKALGTAGSLYAASAFDSINPQLVSNLSALTPFEQAEKFINEAHRRNIRVMIDLPCCGAYDLYLQRPELFVKDSSGQPVTPEDWTDVRLLNSGSEFNVNKDVYNLYKDFVDMVLALGADGIRADVATNKPAKLWKDLISYSRKKDPNFMWLAEASDSWNKPVHNLANFTPYNKLLEVGFDGYYGSFFDVKDFKSAKQLTDLITKTKNSVVGYEDKKSVIGSFATHDEMSPFLTNGRAFAEMIIWLNATLPLNSYFVDGFDSGDNYIYLWGNKKAFKTFTDDDYYFVHRGKLDIFNFSRCPGGKDIDLTRNFALANHFKLGFNKLIDLGKLNILKTDNASVFAYAISYENQTMIVVGNINFRENVEAQVKVSQMTTQTSVAPIKIKEPPLQNKGSISYKLEPGEVQILIANNFMLK